MVSWLLRPVCGWAVWLQDSFIVCHYAGRVQYEGVGFLEKNRDTLQVRQRPTCLPPPPRALASCW